MVTFAVVWRAAILPLATTDCVFSVQLRAAFLVLVFWGFCLCLLRFVAENPCHRLSPLALSAQVWLLLGALV